MGSTNNIPPLVTFDNAKEYPVNFGSPNKILVEYVVNPEHRVTCKDWVGIFPNDCIFQHRVDLDRLVAYEFVLHRPVSPKESRYEMKISLARDKTINFDDNYVFVYFNSYGEFIGVSDIFRFIDPTARERLPKAQGVKNTPYVLGTENRQEMQNEHVGNNKIGKERTYRPKQSFFPLSKEITVETNTLGNEENCDINQECPIYTRKNKRYYQGHSNKFHRELVQWSGNNPPFFTNCKPNFNCSNCSRVGALLKTQSDLYIQVKNLDEINKELHGKIAYLERQIELGQAAYQKQNVTLMRERESRLFYQHQVKESGQINQNYLNIYQPVLVGFDYYQSPIIAYQAVQFATEPQQTSSDPLVVLTPLDPAPETRPRSEENIRVNQMLKFKAVIGNQEEKLRSLTLKLALEVDKVRSLTEKLAELQCDKPEKVKAVIKDIEDLSCGDNPFNNNVGEEVENN